MAQRRVQRSYQTRPQAPRGKPLDGPRIIGANIRRLRKSLELFQEALAERAELHWTYVGSVERGERNVSVVNVCRLAWALGVGPGELFLAD